MVWSCTGHARRRLPPVAGPSAPANPVRSRGLSLVHEVGDSATGHVVHGQGHAPEGVGGLDRTAGRVVGVAGPVAVVVPALGQLAVGVVVHPLEQRVADTMDHAAFDLAIDQQRIDQPPTVMRHGILDQLDLAGD